MPLRKNAKWSYPTCILIATSHSTQSTIQRLKAQLLCCMVLRRSTQLRRLLLPPQSFFASVFSSLLYLLTSSASLSLDAPTKSSTFLPSCKGQHSHQVSLLPDICMFIRQKGCAFANLISSGSASTEKCGEVL